MENNKNKKSVKFQGDMLNFYDFIQVFVFTTNHHLNEARNVVESDLNKECFYAFGNDGCNVLIGKKSCVST